MKPSGRGNPWRPPIVSDTIASWLTLLGFVFVSLPVEIIEECQHEHVLRNYDGAWPERVAALVDEWKTEMEAETDELHLESKDEKNTYFNRNYYTKNNEVLKV